MKTLSRAALALAVAAVLGCKNPPATPAATDAGSPSSAARDVPSARVEAPVAVPDYAMVAFRGVGLRKVLDVLAPGVPTRLALGQAIPGLTPGVGEHGVDLDPDAPFAALMMAGEAEGGRAALSLVAAWPLRPGMPVAQDAAAGRGFREVSPGVYAPTADVDAGRGATPCWVARKQPVGWMMLCGPRELVQRSTNWLTRAAQTTPEGNPVLVVDVRPEPARTVFAAQVAALEAQDPRRNDAGAQRERVAAYEEVHRGAVNTRQLVDDLSALHAVLTRDEGLYHLRGHAEFAHATGPSTRALLGTAVGRRAAADLLALLPASVTSYFATGFDMAAFTPLLSPPETDPRVAAALGPEFVRFQEALGELTGFRRSGERVMGFSPEDGGVKYEIIRMPDPADAVTTLRNRAMAVPRTPRPSGMNPGDQFAVLPTPASLPAGTLRMRLGPDPARLPPNVPAEVRRQFMKTVLLVPQDGRLVIVEAADPVARFQAMGEGPRLAADAGGDDRAALARLTAQSLLVMLGAPQAATEPGGDPMQGVLTARRLGDNGGRFELTVDAPTAAVNTVRAVLAQLQQQAMEQAQQQRQAQQQAMQQAQQAARRAAQGAGARGPVQLPDPDFRLPEPGLR